MIGIWDFVVRVARTLIKIDKLLAQIKSFFDDDEDE